MNEQDEGAALKAWYEALAEKRWQKITELEASLVTALKESQDFKLQCELLQHENKRLRDLLERAVYYIDAHPSQRIITTGEKIVNEARKLMNP